MNDQCCNFATFGYLLEFLRYFKISTFLVINGSNQVEKFNLKKLDFAISIGVQLRVKDILIFQLRIFVTTGHSIHGFANWSTSTAGTTGSA